MRGRFRGVLSPERAGQQPTAAEESSVNGCKASALSWFAPPAKLEFNEKEKTLPTTGKSLAHYFDWRAEERRSEREPPVKHDAGWASQCLLGALGQIAYQGGSESDEDGEESE